MTVRLDKGGSVNLSKGSPGLTSVVVGLGWDARATRGYDFDLDASAIGVGAHHRVPSDGWFVFYNNTASPDGTIEHSGDNTTGDGDGDDEQMVVHLSRVPESVQRIVIPVTIHDAEIRGQTFGQVRNAYIRILNGGPQGPEVARYDLSEDASTETAMVFGELYREGADWQFRAVGHGHAGGLGGIARDFGVNV